MSISRLNTFNGQLINESDFTDEQNYHRLMRYRHNKDVHTEGVVYGLGVTDTSVGTDYKVTVALGWAIDSQGREMVLDDAVPKDIVSFPSYITCTFNETDDPESAQDIAVTGTPGFRRTIESAEIAVETPTQPADTLILAKVDLVDSTLDISKPFNTSGLIVKGDISTDGDLTVKGNLEVQGETTLITADQMEGNVILGNEIGDAVTVMGYMVGNSDSPTNELVIGNSDTDTVKLNGVMVTGNTSTNLEIGSSTHVDGNLTVTGTITGDIAVGIVQAADLVDDAVTSAKLSEADGSSGQTTTTGSGVKTGHIQDGAVSNAKLANDSVDGAKIATGAVGNTELANDAVDAAKISAAAVGNTELANDSVDAAKIATGAVGNTELANNSVDGAKIAAGAVGNTELANDSVDAAKIAAGAVGNTELANDAVDAAKISTGAVGNTELADNSVDAAKISNDAVTHTQLRADTATDVNRAVTTNHIRNLAVTSEKIADGAITADKIDTSVNLSDINRLHRVPLLQQTLFSRPFTTISGINNGREAIFDGSHMWVVSATSPGTVSKININTNLVEGAPIAVGNNPYGLAFDGTYIWVSNNGSGTVNKIHINGTTIEAGIDIPVTNPAGMAFDGSHIWVSSTTTNFVTKINISDNSHEIVQVEASTRGVAFDGEHIWVTHMTTPGYVRKIRISDNFVAGPFAVGTRPWGIAFDGKYIWVANYGSANLSKIDITTNAVAGTIPIGAPVSYALYDGAHLWVTSYQSPAGSAFKTDVYTHEILAQIPVGAYSAGLGFDGTSLWVPNLSSHNVSIIRKV